MCAVYAGLTSSAQLQAQITPAVHRKSCVKGSVTPNDTEETVHAMFRQILDLHWISLELSQLFVRFI